MPTITFDQDTVATTAEGSHTFTTGQELELDPENPWQPPSDGEAPSVTLNSKSQSYTVPLWSICREDRRRLGMGLAIPAEIHSDDHQEQAIFDALTWFERAKDHDILELASVGYERDEAADDVARWTQEWQCSRDPMEDMESVVEGRDIFRVLDYDGGGFEVTIDAESATAWITLERPHLLVEIDADGE